MRRDNAQGDEFLWQYLSDVSRIPLLSRDQEEALGRRIACKDKDAVCALVEANLRLVVSIARRFAHRGIPLFDLIQEGNLALLQAAQRFDWRRGQRFSTYAVPWIRYAITRVISAYTHIASLSDRRTRELLGLRRMVESLRQALGREPSAEEIARELGWSIGRVRETLALLETPVSLDALASEEDTLQGVPPALEVPGPDDCLAPELRREAIQRLLKRLSPREREVIRLRFGLSGGRPRTMREVGRRLGLTAEGVRQIEKRALSKLRAAYLDQLRDLAG
jgi:RNA polymerase primary sigma factor